MRRTRNLTALLISLSLVWAEPASADFNPFGRKRKSSRKVTKPKRGTSTSRRRTPAPKRKKATRATQQTRTKALIKRYTAIVLSQPGVAFPLARLAELYRTRDGNLDKLLIDFEKRRRDSQSTSEQYTLTVSLAGLYAEAGREAEAIALYQAGIKAKPTDPIALLALSELHQNKNRPELAVELLEQAVNYLKNATNKELRQRELLELYLGLQRFDDAKRVHKELVKRAKGSYFVRAELGRALLDRQQYQRAEVELRELVKAVRGDYRAQAPALRDLARALLGQGKTTESIQVLERALRTTQKSSGVRRELLQLSVRAHRAAGSLTTLISKLENNTSKDPLKLSLLAGLHEETGQLDRAAKLYQQAIRQRPNDPDIHLKLINLFQLKGDLQSAVAQYSRLVRLSPENPQFVFDWVNALLQLGKRKEALAELRKLETRSRQDEQTGAALVEFYEQLGEQEQSLRLLQRLASGAGKDPAHVIELGNRYYDKGDTEKAKRTWKRLLVLVKNRARALHLLGEVYAEHDLAELAIESLTEASRLQPKQLRYQKSLALALERTGTTASTRVRQSRYESALQIWHDLLSKTDPMGGFAMEARNHIITLWNLSGVSKQRVVPLQQRLRRTPPDVEAGRLLAELHIRRQRYRQAETTLNEVLIAAPGDLGSYLRLERVLLLQRKLPEAIVVLEKLTTLAPKRARQFYHRMAKYSAELYRDDDALKYAAKAVALSPDDADGHFRLAEMYSKRREFKSASQEYRQAISKNDRLFAAYFQLAELLVNERKVQEADKLYARVMRHAVDDKTIERAVRARFHLHLTRGSLHSVEQDLLPLALGKPQKSVYRRSLIEVYGAMTAPLVQRAKLSGTAPTHLVPDPETLAKKAKQSLRSIGKRAVKPLLDALGDDSAGAQHTALQLLTHVENPSANDALFAYATSEAPPELRTRAMLAIGVTNDPGMLARYEKLLTRNGRLQIDEGAPVELAAVWSIARQDSRKAERLLLRVLQSDAPSARALAALALGFKKVSSAGPILLSLLEQQDAGTHLRSAAAFALGQLRVTGATKKLIDLTRAPDTETRSLALVSLGQLGKGKTVIAQAIFSGRESVSQAAAAAASSLAGHEYRPQGSLFATPPGRVELAELLQSVHPIPAPATARAKSIHLLQKELVDAAQVLLRGTEEQARRVTQVLRSHNQQLSLGSLTNGLQDSERTPSITRALGAVHGAVAQHFLSRWPDASTSLKASILRVLSHSSELKQTRKLVLTSLQSQQPELEAAALAAIAEAPHREYIPKVMGKLMSVRERDWVRRVRLLEALEHAHIAAQSWRNDTLWSQPVTQLAQLALDDRYALVREAALKALAQLAPSAARKTLRHASKNDTAPAVRQVAQALLQRTLRTQREN